MLCIVTYLDGEVQEIEASDNTITEGVVVFDAGKRTIAIPIAVIKRIEINQEVEKEEDE